MSDEEYEDDGIYNETPAYDVETEALQPLWEIFCKKAVEVAGDDDFCFITVADEDFNFEPVLCVRDADGHHRIHHILVIEDNYFTHKDREVVEDTVNHLNELSGKTIFESLDHGVDLPVAGYQ